MNEYRLKDFIPFSNTYAKTFFDYLPSAIKNLYSDYGENIGECLTNNLRMKYFNRRLNDFLPEFIENYYNIKDFANLTDVEYTEILTQMMTPYIDKFVKLWVNVVEQTYIPLDNYNGTIESTTGYGKTESNSQNQSGTNSNSVTGSNTGTVTDSNTGTITDTNSGTSSDTNSMQGFNSSNFNNRDKKDIIANSTNTNTQNTEKETTQNLSNTENQSGTNTATVTGSQTAGGSDTYSEHKHGNLGITTSQQMLTSEITFRQWVFFDELVEQVANILTYKFY